MAAGRSAFVFKPGEGVRYEMAAVEGAVEPAEPSLHAVSEEMPVQEVLLDELPSEEPAKSVQAKTAADILAERMKNLPHEPRHTAGSASRPESEVLAKARTDAQRDAEEARYEQTNLSPDYTFDTLVEGKGNRLAAAAAQAIAESPGQSYNPFFLYGSTGLGKTHLVQAVGNELLKNRPDAKVRYMHS
ncbi:DnaA/Hda family protein, partial [Klebsiella pneumoniae]|nr:DnaA/Hda family protein [Klebsiella pneumoniae]